VWGEGEGMGGGREGGREGGGREGGRGGRGSNFRRSLRRPALFPSPRIIDRIIIVMYLLMPRKSAPRSVRRADGGLSVGSRSTW